MDIDTEDKESYMDSSDSVPDKIQELDTKLDAKVSTEVSIFKFKKVKRLFGGIEISSVKKWIMLTKNVYQGDIIFTHFCLYRDKEFNTVTGVHIFEGFMKGERFVVTRNRMLNNKGFNDFNILTKLSDEIEKLSRDSYYKDEKMYLYGEPCNPSYFKDPEETEKEVEDDPEVDLRKAAVMLVKKKESFIEDLLKQTKELNNEVPLIIGSPEELEAKEDLSHLLTTFPIEEKPKLISLFKRKVKEITINPE